MLQGSTPKAQARSQGWPRAFPQTRPAPVFEDVPGSFAYWRTHAQAVRPAGLDDHTTSDKPLRCSQHGAGPGLSPGSRTRLLSDHRLKAP